LRQRPGPGVGEALPGSFLKHADEQTVVGLAAVLQAIHSSELRSASFGDWGIVAAPCFLGRSLLAAALHRFAVEGAWGMSPHFIPHHSGHSVSGTISQVLKSHGPNFGAGGGPGGAVDALVSGAVLIDANHLPGAWVVLVGYNLEPIPERDGSCSSPVVCHAAALALGAERPGRQGLHLRIVPEDRGQQPEPAAGPATLTCGNLEALLATITRAEDPASTLVWQIDGGGRLEIRKGGAAEKVHLNGTGPPANGQRAADVRHRGVSTEKRW
jgi:hypothetical protein